MKKEAKLKLIVVLFIILMIVLIVGKITKKNSDENTILQKTTALFDSVDKSSIAKVSKYIIYGTHLNIEGTIKIPKISGITVDNVNLILKDIDNNSQTIETKFSSKNDILSFSTIKEINTGVDLEKLSNTNYYFLVQVKFSNSDEKFYSLENNSKYKDLTYYTLTKENSNNKIDLKFGNINEIEYMGLFSSKVESLPENVYDIVIDPGHGGKDTGAVSGKNCESDIVLSCSKILKNQLEKLGYKIFVTRDGTESKDENTAYSMYDDDGRVNIAQESNAKILISLHMNSNSAELSSGGIEVYAPSNCNLDFAKLLSNNIVKKAKTTYSSLKTYKEADGVYVRNFNNAEILAFKNRAIRDKYDPYDINTSTPYLYIIREIGGIATNAFVDGRNTIYGANKYINSNVGIEGYLIELGYMIINKDLNNILKNEKLYMQAIADSISSFYK